MHLHGRAGPLEDTGLGFKGQGVAAPLASASAGLAQGATTGGATRSAVAATATTKGSGALPWVSTGAVAVAANLATRRAAFSRPSAASLGEEAEGGT